MGFIGSSIRLQIQVSQAAIQRRERTHKTRLACLHGKINGGVEAEIVKGVKRETALRCSHPDKGSNVIKTGKEKKGNARLNAVLFDGKLSRTFLSNTFGNRTQKLKQLSVEVGICGKIMNR